MSSGSFKNVVDEKCLQIIFNVVYLMPNPVYTYTLKITMNNDMPYNPVNQPILKHPLELVIK